MRSGVLASTQAMKTLHTRATKIPVHELPKCAACQFGRQTNRKVPVNRTSIIRELEGILSAEKLHPGQLVFIDHFLSSTRGRKIEGYGIRHPKTKVISSMRDKSYGGGCIFVAAASGYIDIKFQSFLTADETVEAVTEYEKHALDNGVIVTEYHSDNGGAFTSKRFKEHLIEQGQNNRYSSAGSHHQNGRAERAIRTIMAMARTMMLHTGLHWSDVDDATLWPMAVRHATYTVSYTHLTLPTILLV